jgi:ABC-type Fe3+ transport system substrate-binding protein
MGHLAMKLNKKIAKLCSSLLGLLLTIGIVHAQSDELIAAAKKEGKVMIYGEMITPTLRAVKEGFEAKYPGITMEFIYLSGAPLMNRIVSEQDAKRYLADVIAIDSVRMPVLIEKGYIAPYRSSQIDYYDAKWLSANPSDMWIRNHLYLGGVMYNTKAVPPDQVPKTFDDLLDPKWKGKIAMVSPVTNDLIFTMYAGLVRDWGEPRAYKFFDALAAQKPLVFGPGGIRVSQGVGTGEFPLGIGFIGHTYSVGLEPGYNMAVAPINPLYAVGGPGFALVKTAPHPNAGKLVIDYMLSTPVQEKIASMGYRTNNKDAKGMASLNAAPMSVGPVLEGAEADKLRTKLKQLFGG